MGVAALITVMTLIQGANRFVETKIANLGTDVFQIARTPFAVTDFNLVIKALKYPKIEMDQVQEVASRCRNCELVGASAASQGRVRYRDEEIQDVSILGHTANMDAIDTRTLSAGRYFTATEDQRSAAVCLIGDTLRERFFSGVDPLNREIHLGAAPCQIIGVFERIGALFGQDQDNFLILPMNTYLRLYGRRASLTINVKASGEQRFLQAQDEVRQLLRAARHVPPAAEDDFFLATKESYIALWRSISGAFVAVFFLVSAISSVVGGVVIMNVMLVSVAERKKEIGIRRAAGATQKDIGRQFLAESLIQCLAGGAAGVVSGILFAFAVRRATAFPVEVEAWVVVFGLAMSSSIGLFFGIYPALTAARLDPVVALQAD